MQIFKNTKLFAFKDKNLFYQNKNYFKSSTKNSNKIKAIISEDWIRIGIIGGSHGIDGTVRFQSLTDFPNERLKNNTIMTLLEPEGNFKSIKNREIKKFKLLNSKTHVYKGHNLWLLKFDEIKTPEQAKEIKGYEIIMDPKDRHELTNENEFYIQDLIGLNIYEFQKENDEIIGEVTSVTVDNGPQDILHLKLKQCNEIILLPFVYEFVPIVDLEKKKIELKLPDGLIESQMVDDKKIKKKNRKSRTKNVNKVQ